MAHQHTDLSNLSTTTIMAHHHADHINHTENGELAHPHTVVNNTMIVISGVQVFTNLFFILFTLKIRVKKPASWLFLNYCLGSFMLGLNTMWYPLSYMVSPDNHIAMSFAMLLTSTGHFASHGFMSAYHLISYLTIRSNNFVNSETLQKKVNLLIGCTWVVAFSLSFVTWIIPYSSGTVTCDVLILFGGFYIVHSFVVFGPITVFLILTVTTSFLLSTYVDSIFFKTHISPLFRKRNKIHIEKANEGEGAIHHKKIIIRAISTETLQLNEDRFPDNSSHPAVHFNATFKGIRDEDVDDGVDASNVGCCLNENGLTTDKPKATTFKDSNVKQIHTVKTSHSVNKTQRTPWEVKIIITNLVGTAMILLLTGPLVITCWLRLFFNLPHDVFVSCVVLYTINSVTSPFFLSWRIPQVRKQFGEIC